jgi:hypothetical protein
LAVYLFKYFLSDEVQFVGDRGLLGHLHRGHHHLRSDHDSHDGERADDHDMHQADTTVVQTSQPSK